MPVVKSDATYGGGSAPKPPIDNYADPEPIPAIRVLPWTDNGETSSRQALMSEGDLLNTQASLAFVDPSHISDSHQFRAAITPALGAFGMRPPNVSTANGGGVIGDFADIFGQTSRIGQNGLTDEGLRDAEIPNREQTYSDLKRNQVTRLATQINHYVRLDDSLYTSQNGGLAPLQRTDATSIVYDDMIFDTQVIPPNPELAPTRFMGFRRKTTQHAFIRHGVGIRGTTDFMKSAEGRAIVAQQIIQILNSIHETLAFGCIYSILTSDNVQRQQVRRWRRFRNNTAMYDLLEDERMRWDMLKHPKGIYKADAIASRRLQEARGEADTWLLAPDATTFIALEHKISTIVSDSGERLALGARNDSVNAIKQWMDSKVAILRTYAVDDGAVENPLQFRAQIGEYYLTKNSQHGRYDAAAQFDPLCTAVEIYDESSNKWALIETAACLRNCSVFKQDGTPERSRPARALGARADVPGAVKNWTDVPTTFYDVVTGFAWPYLASLLYASCHENPMLYRMFAQSMIQAMERGTRGRLGNQNWADTSGEIDAHAAVGGGLTGAGIAALALILQAGTITGLPAITSENLKLGNAATAESPIGFLNGAENVKWFKATAGVGNGTQLAPDRGGWLYSGGQWGVGGGGTPELVNSATVARSADITFVLEAVNPAAVAGNGNANDGGKCVPHLAQVMFDTLHLSATERVALRILGAIPFHRDHLEKLHTAGVVLPVSFLLMRPHAEYTTLTAVKMMAGLPTAATYVKEGLFEMGSDAVIGEVAGKFTWHSKTVILKPNNVIVLENSFVNGYIGGMNAEFIVTSPQEGDKYHPAAGRYGSKHVDADNPDVYNQRERPSMYCFLVPYWWAHSPKVPNPISLHGALHVDLADNRPSIEIPGSRSFKFPGLAWYENIFQFKQRIVPSPDIFSRPVVNLVVPTNAVAWQGHTRYWDPITKSFGTDNYTQKGTGHWGPEGTYIGCADFRKGNLSKEPLRA